MPRLLLLLLCCCLLPALAASQDSLKLLTWNIQMLPDGAALFSKSLRKMQAKRLPWIVEYLEASDYEVVALQEVFDRQQKRRLLRRLKKSYPYQVSTHTRRGAITSNGLVVLSRLPMRYVGHCIYKKGISSDKMAAKGCTLVEIDKNGKHIHIANTHLQSGGSEDCQTIRCAQYGDICTLLQTHSTKADLELLLGDLNTEKHLKERYADMLRRLNMSDFDIQGDERPYTIDHTNYWKESDEQSQLDYILLRPNPRLPKAHVTGLQVIRPRRLYKGKNIDLADHYGVSGWLVW